MTKAIFSVVILVRTPMKSDQSKLKTGNSFVSQQKMVTLCEKNRRSISGKLSRTAMENHTSRIYSSHPSCKSLQFVTGHI